MSIGQRLVEERRRLGMTQVDLIALTNTSRTSQFNYESDRSIPDGNYLVAIAKVGADILYILTGCRMVGSVLPEEVEVLKKDEREMLMDYRQSPIDMRRNMRSVIATLAQQSHRGTGDAGGRFQRQEMRNRMGEEHAVAA